MIQKRQRFFQSRLARQSLSRNLNSSHLLTFVNKRSIVLNKKEMHAKPEKAS